MAELESALIKVSRRQRLRGAPRGFVVAFVRGRSQRGQWRERGACSCQRCCRPRPTGRAPPPRSKHSTASRHLQVPFESLKRTTRDRKYVIDDIEALRKGVQALAAAPPSREQALLQLEEYMQQLQSLKRKVGGGERGGGVHHKVGWKVDGGMEGELSSCSCWRARLHKGREEAPATPPFVATGLSESARLLASAVHCQSRGCRFAPEFAPRPHMLPRPLAYPSTPSYTSPPSAPWSKIGIGGALPPSKSSPTPPPPPTPLSFGGCSSPPPAQWSRRRWGAAGRGWTTCGTWAPLPGRATSSGTGGAATGCWWTTCCAGTTSDPRRS